VVVNRKKAGFCPGWDYVRDLGYFPRLRVSVRTLEDLLFYAVPAVLASWLTFTIAKQLNLFAGQLYIQTYEEYKLLYSFLGLCF
jgi:hypothetical protein